MEKEVFDNEFATVWVDQEKKIVHHRFKKFIFGDEFKQVLLKGADAFERNRCTKWLSDDRENTAIRLEDHEWGITEWKPKMFKAGWKHWAIVIPKKIFGELSIKNISMCYEELGLNVQLFYDFDEASTWLEQQ